MKKRQAPVVIESEKYESLAELIEAYVDGPLAKLPNDLRMRVAEAFFPMPHWDGLTPDQRRSLARQHDIQHDPAMESENRYWFELECTILEKEKEIAEWKLKHDQNIPSEALIKRNELATLNAELSALKKQRDEPYRVSPLGVSQTNALGSKAKPVVTVGASDEFSALPNWKMKVQIEAYEHWIRLRASGGNPTVHSILNDMVTWCQRNNVRTDTNIHPSAGYLRTHILGGGNWDSPTMSIANAKKHVEQVAQLKLAQVPQ